jgi:hypothetical protein
MMMAWPAAAGMLWHCQGGDIATIAGKGVMVVAAVSVPRR